MDFHALIVSGNGSDIETVIKLVGKISSDNITKVGSIDDALNTLENLAMQGDKVWLIFYDVGNAVDSGIKEFPSLMANVGKMRPPALVIVKSTYDMPEKVKAMQPEMSVAGLFMGMGAYRHIPSSANPGFIRGLVYVALAEYEKSLGQSGAK